MPQSNTITTTTTPDTAAPFVALKQPAVEALARILYFSRATASPPKTDAACQRWLRRQKRQIADLDEMSLRRPCTLSLLGGVLFRRGGALARRRPQETLEAEGAAALCPSHNRLDPRVLMALMALVAEEVTVWTESGKEKRRSVAGERKRRGAGEEEEEEAAAAAATAVEVWRKNMIKIAVLWMGRRCWGDDVGRGIEKLEVPPCARYRGCCAACKLAVVGGSVQFLIDLRTGLLARRELARGLQDKDEPPPLLRMVEAWIDVCYTRRRQRFMRTESDMMVNLLVRMQTSGGGSGRNASGGRGGGEQRTKKTQFRGWPMPVMQVEVDELIRNAAAAAAADDDDDDIEENEYGRGAATQWRRGKRLPEKEGYLQYIPASPRAGPEPWTARRGGGTATHNAKRVNADYRRAPPPHVEPPWMTPDYDPPAAAASLAAEPCHVDYDDWSIRRQATWSFSSSSATLSAIYDAYHTAARSTTTVATSLCAPSPLFTQRGAAAAEAPRSGAVSPPSPSVYSPVHKSSQSAAAAAAAAATTPRWGASATSTRPPLPLQQRRLLSEITVPKRAKTAAAALRPPPLVIVRDPVQSVRVVSSTL